MGAGEPGELHREAPHPTGGAGDEHPPTEHRAGDVERLQRGEPGNRQRGGLHVGDPGGQLAERLRGHGGELRPRPAPDQTDDPRALRGTGAVGRRGLEHPRDVPAGELPVGHLGEPPRLAAVERERAHAHERLGGQRHGVGHLAQAHVRGRAGSCGEGEHGSILTRGGDRDRGSFGIIHACAYSHHAGARGASYPTSAD